MLLGIDVGGTYTDAVLIDGGILRSFAKVPTDHGQLLNSIEGALDVVLKGVAGRTLTRVALSTTLVTNTIVEGKIRRVGVLAIPGPGVNIEPHLPGDKNFIVTGSIDHRGREVEPVAAAEVAAAVDKIAAAGIDTVAVAGKFSVRNPQHELQVAEWARNRHPALRYIAMGHTVSGSLNFPRRLNTAYLNAATWQRYQEFAVAVQAALERRAIAAPVYVLKADGGTMPLAASRNYPVETIFTGPAASVLGVQALCRPDGTAVMVDIGGTTTDIALWQRGAPLFVAKGAKVGPYRTLVRAFLVKSVGVGGDSRVRLTEGRIVIGPERCGPAAALGGPEPTPTDALRVLGLTRLGDAAAAARALDRLAESRGADRETLAREIIAEAQRRIAAAVTEMIREREAEPVYRVADIVSFEKIVPEQVIGIGGAAPGLVPGIARLLGCPHLIPPGAMVANAVGAAIARPTMVLTLRADTEQRTLSIVEEGIQAPLPHRRFTREEAIALASDRLRARAARFGFSGDSDVEVIHAEEFNMVRGFATTGKLLTVVVQLKPGILNPVTLTGEVAV